MPIPILSTKELAAFAGIFIGIIGLCFGFLRLLILLLNHFRDNPQIKVELIWDESIANRQDIDPEQLCGAIKISNVGRRPINIESATLFLPNKQDTKKLLFSNSLNDKRLEEGGPPEIIAFPQSGMEIFSKDWQNIYAEITDSAGKKYRSTKMAKSRKPSWAT